MAEITSPNPLDSVQKTVESFRKILGDLKDILDQLNKARSVVCTIINATDSALIYDTSDHPHGGFATNPPPTISPRTAAAFSSQSSAGAIATGTEGTVYYRGNGFRLRCHWDNPWAGENNADIGVEGDPQRFMTWCLAGSGDQKAEIQYVVFERLFQDQWRFCRKCNAMFYNGFPEKGTCSADSGGHDAGDSFNFALLHDAPAPVTAQADWRFCQKCNMMFFNGFPTKGTCPKGGSHEAAGWNFVLAHDAPPPEQQDHWRFCEKCNAVFYNGFPAKGTCPVDTGGHKAAGWNFSLPHDAPAPERQDQWRFCEKCNAMFYDGFPAKGICPVDRGGHKAAGWNFTLPHDVSGPGQPQWRFCEKCNVMFYDGFPGKGVCPVDRGGHKAAGWNFVLPNFAPGPQQQNDWRFCRKCNAMFYDGFSEKGVCPARGGHEAAGFMFVLKHN